MKVLFIGTGLTHYYNQILNRLNQQPNVEIVNLIDSGGLGHAGNSVFQTNKGVNFKVVALKEITRNKFSNYSFKSFVGFSNLLKELEPEIIVISETYLKMFLYDKNVKNIAKKLDIKLIMRDIPFRMKEYEEVRNKILSGEFDSLHTPVFTQFFIRACNKLKLKKISALLEKIIHRTYSGKFFVKLVGRKVLLKKLEIKRGIYNMVDAHADYIEEAYGLFGSYGVPKEKIFIIYNSPDTDFLLNIRKKIEQEPPILPLNPHRLIHIGRLVKWKRVDMLIKSLSQIKKEFPDTELLIIGYGPQEESLKDLTKKSNLESSVKFIGGIYEPEELGKYLMSSAIYVLAGMGGISINDAMVFGRPVICSVCDGTEKKLVRNDYNGLYFEDGNGEDLTEKILHLFRNPESIKRMGENSTNIIKNEINIHTVIGAYLRAFNYVLNKNGN